MRDASCREGRIASGTHHGSPPKQALQFLLVPDASAARLVRRSLATTKARTGILVGTFGELLHRGLAAYLLDEGLAEQDQRFYDEVARIGDAFWSKSFEVAPDETAAEIRATLINLISATDPLQDLERIGAGRLSARPRRVVRDLTRLALSLDRSLPGSLGDIRSLLHADPSSALRAIRVYASASVMHLTRWQRELVEKLNRDASLAGMAADPGLSSEIEEILARRSRAEGGSALEALQCQLFAPSGSRSAVDHSVQCVGVRDFYQEAEIAAGMAQSLLANDPGLVPADIGLLLPDEFSYAIALEDAFQLAGLALSGLRGERWRRDLGAEAVFHFLFCQQKPAPAMALAACLSSPLMPWTAEDGAGMARRVMERRYDLAPPPGAGREAEAMLETIRQEHSDPRSLQAALDRFGSLLSGGENFSVHRARAREAAKRASDTLEGANQIDWVATRRAASPRHITNGEPAFHSVEGVTVLRERHEPWRDVRHLFVLGFHQGRYPREPRSSAVFLSEYLLEIRRVLEIPIGHPADELGRRRQRFRRQLSAASDSVTLLIPRRQETGAPQSPSESLVFIERLLSGSGSGAGDKLVAELDSADDRARIRHLAVAPSSKAVPPRNLRCGDLGLGRDLTALRPDSDGRARPESPSSLETLLVSPLAWLLRRVDAEPLAWAPETAGPSVLGSLAHGMFERLFRPGTALPEGSGMSPRARKLLDEVSLQQAPFVRNPQWRVERLHLAEQAAKAAAMWRDALESLGAEVLASEQWLQGEWSRIRVHGQADLILALDGDRLLIVDYKWSRSGGRSKRMETGFDTQATLYRAMVQSGGPKPRRGVPPNREEEELAGRLARADEIGIVYFMMKDRVCLGDSALPGGVAIPGWHTVSEDVAREATIAIRDRLDDARKGIVRLNVDTDRDSFANSGVSTFALDASPLIDLFTLTTDERRAST